jgi:hypothetical protein
MPSEKIRQGGERLEKVHVYKRDRFVCPEFVIDKKMALPYRL